MAYRPRRILTEEEIKEITILYRYQVPARTIGVAFGLGYQKINAIISVVKATHEQHTPTRIKNDLLRLQKATTPISRMRDLVEEIS